MPFAGESYIIWEENIFIIMQNKILSTYRDFFCLFMEDSICLSKNYFRFLTKHIASDNFIFDMKNTFLLHFSLIKWTNVLSEIDTNI